MWKMGVVVLCLAALLASGCTTTSGGVAASSMPLKPGDFSAGRRVSGSSWGIYALWFIPVTFPSTSAALDDAVRVGGGQPLVQVTADTRKYYWVPFFYLERIEVTGNTTR
jgi:hypothetical protein